MRFVSGEEFQKAQERFDELNCYDEDGNLLFAKEFNEVLDICLAYMKQCFGQKLNESLISSCMASKPKRAALPIILICKLMDE